MTNPRSDELREQAADAVTDDDLIPMYTGLVCEVGRHEYYFGNGTEEATDL